MLSLYIGIYVPFFSSKINGSFGAFTQFIVVVVRPSLLRQIEAMLGKMRVVPACAARTVPTYCNRTRWIAKRVRTFLV